MALVVDMALNLQHSLIVFGESCITLAIIAIGLEG